MLKRISILMLALSLGGCAARKQAPSATVAAPSADALRWAGVETPYPAANITAVANVFWICGSEEMIASSSDGGKTWKLRHSKPGGDVLLEIAFVNDKIGHATGRGGLLLSTTNGGKTWQSHHVDDDVQAFSFADARNGIAVFGRDNDAITYRPTPAGIAPLDGTVKLTHDAGRHWESIPTLESDRFKPFNLTAAVAALDPLHYLIIRRHNGIEDVFIVTQDGGRNWNMVHQRNDTTNREMAKWVFVHGGEYWGFGMELLNRQQGGGYSFPLAEHSPDGRTWTHGANGGKEFGGCNPQGCYMWDGTVESLFGAYEQYWNLPQDFTLSNKWAIAGKRACTISSVTECGPALPSDHPQAMRWGHFEIKQPQLTNLPFARDCKMCGVKVIWPDPGLDWSGRVLASVSISEDGSVTDLSLDGTPENSFVRGQIRQQIEQWKFVVLPSAKPQQRTIEIDVNCLDIPDAPTVDGCHLQPASKPI